VSIYMGESGSKGRLRYKQEELNLFRDLNIIFLKYRNWKQIEEEYNYKINYNRSRINKTFSKKWKEMQNGADSLLNRNSNNTESDGEDIILNVLLNSLIQLSFLEILSTENPSSVGLTGFLKFNIQIQIYSPIYALILIHPLILL
jgi:hypothetical protein